MTVASSTLTEANLQQGIHVLIVECHVTTHTKMQLGYADVMKGCSDITHALQHRFWKLPITNYGFES